MLLLLCCCCCPQMKNYDLMRENAEKQESYMRREDILKQQVEELEGQLARARGEQSNTPLGRPMQKMK